MRELSLSLLLTVLLSAAAKTVTVSTEYIYQIPDNISNDEAKEIALHRARAQAIAEEFGTIVSQSTSMTVENVNGSSTTDFLLFGGSDLKGEWIEDIIAPEFEFITNGGSVAVKVKIKGKVRDIKGAPISVSAKLFRNGTSPSCETDRFDSGDDLFASFQSPVSGYLAVYLIDNSKNAYCLLPYQNQEEGVFEIKSNKNYILFSSDNPGALHPEIVDTFVVETDDSQERNRIIFIFSPNRFFKGVDKKISSDYPRALSIQEFQKWLSDVRGKDKDVTVHEKIITIVK